MTRMPRDIVNRAQRLPTRLAVRLQFPDGSETGSMLDLSTMGAKVWLGRPLSPGTAVTLTLLGRRIEGQVKWSGRNVLGLAFAEPMPEATVARIAATL